jgi:hypothetical protein
MADRLPSGLVHFTQASPQPSEMAMQTVSCAVMTAMAAIETDRRMLDMQPLA